MLRIFFICLTCFTRWFSYCWSRLRSTATSLTVTQTRILSLSVSVGEFFMELQFVLKEVHMCILEFDLPILALSLKTMFHTYHFTDSFAVAKWLRIFYLVKYIVLNILDGQLLSLFSLTKHVIFAVLAAYVSSDTRKTFSYIYRLARQSGCGKMIWVISWFVKHFVTIY